MPEPGFAPLPSHQRIGLAWPTPNHFLFSDSKAYFARTEANEDYGRPGWTRDCGRRFHRGCDIAPVHVEAAGQTTEVEFTNCKTHEDYLSIQPVWIPHDPVFSCWEGVVEEAVANEAGSSFGRHLVIRHAWPETNQLFYSIYAHLDNVLPSAGDQVETGSRIGTMGQTSNNADAINWMRIAPHLHFEVWNASKQPFDPVLFLKKHLKRE